MSGNYPRFSDFAENEVPLEGEKRAIDEILNLGILITDFKISRSKFKDNNYITIQFESSGEKFVVFTGSEVLMNQLERYKEKLPFHATIIKRGRYFTLS